MAIHSYKISKVVMRSSDCVIEYGNDSISLYNIELDGFVPQKGHKLLIDVNKNNVVVGVRINGKRFR